MARKMAYRFELLPVQAQERVLEQLREDAGLFRWWDQVIEMLADDGKSEDGFNTVGLGVRALDPQRGYLACFDWERGELEFHDIWIDDVSRFARWLGLPKHLCWQVALGNCVPSLDRKGERVTWEFPEGEPSEHDQALLYSSGDTAWYDFRTHVLCLLNQEYDYQVSQEKLVEDIEANGWWFTWKGEFTDAPHVVSADQLVLFGHAKPDYPAPRPIRSCTLSFPWDRRLLEDVVA